MKTNQNQMKELTEAADNAVRLLADIQARALALRDSGKLPAITPAIYDVRAIAELARDAAVPLRVALERATVAPANYGETEVAGGGFEAVEPGAPSATQDR